MVHRDRHAAADIESVLQLHDSANNRKQIETVQVDLEKKSNNSRQPEGDTSVIKTASPRQSPAQTPANSGELPPPLPLATLPASPAPEEPPGVSQRAGDTPPTIPTGPIYQIDLSSALRLADAENPMIAESRVMILDALAQQLAARVLLVPSLNAGVNYHGHAGNLQRSSGRILNLSEQSLYFGGGARTLAAESVSIPAINIFSPLTDAIYEPLAARQRVVGTRFDARATANTVLLEVADIYLELLAAESILEAWRATGREADDIVKIVSDFVAQGESRPADAHRAEVERRLLQAEIQRSEERVAVASARLSRRLNLDPAIRLRTVAPTLQPLELVDPSTPTEALIEEALFRRPEIGSRNARIDFADAKLREELARPLLPTIWMGFSGGAFGGGSNLVPPDVGHFAGRTDFDVRAYWTLMNFGAGNFSLQKQRRAEVGQAIADRSRLVNQVRTEIVSAQSRSLSQRQQVELARLGLETSENGYRQDRGLLRESLSRPIEVINSLRLLGDARAELIRAITRSNQAQFALFVALGSPPPAPDIAPPAGPPPVATPLRTPILSHSEPIPPVQAPGPPLIGN